MRRGRGSLPSRAVVGSAGAAGGQGGDLAGQGGGAPGQLCQPSGGVEEGVGDLGAVVAGVDGQRGPNQAVGHLGGQGGQRLGSPARPLDGAGAVLAVGVDALAGVAAPQPALHVSGPAQQADRGVAQGGALVVK